MFVTDVNDCFQWSNGSDTSVILVIFFFLLPWRWSHKWPKHVWGYPLIKLYQNTIDLLLVLILYSVLPSCMRCCMCVCPCVTYYQTAPLLDICLKLYFYVVALSINYEAPSIFGRYLTTTLWASPKPINKLLYVRRKPLINFCSKFYKVVQIWPGLICM